jgi:hypothetical protein
MIFGKGGERLSALHTGYQVMSEKERERERERERETFGFVYWLPGDV